MEELLDRIDEVKESQIQQVLDAVLARYTELYPQWAVSVISVLRNADRKLHNDQMIRLLESIKE